MHTSNTRCMFQDPACYKEVPADIQNLNSLIMLKHQLREDLMDC